MMRPTLLGWGRRFFVAEFERLLGGASSGSWWNCLAGLEGFGLSELING
ncbi:hypothetical protein VDG1235_532 [Verrucomicrobiia bacterium DG1235]|nr:hypothetical protein VDG1235_532 [Verrucomicrobiae bacterium DG1235]